MRVFFLGTGYGSFPEKKDSAIMRRSYGTRNFEEQNGCAAHQKTAFINGIANGTFHGAAGTV